MDACTLFLATAISSDKALEILGDVSGPLEIPLRVLSLRSPMNSNTLHLES